MEAEASSIDQILPILHDCFVQSTHTMNRVGLSTLRVAELIEIEVRL